MAALFLCIIQIPRLTILQTGQADGIEIAKHNRYTGENMAQTTFKGPVTSINGFIGGPNPNASDTQQGGTTAWSFSSTSVVQNATTGETLSAVGNTAVMIYVSNGIAGSPGYAFSNGTTWKRMNAPTTDIATS